MEEDGFGLADEAMLADRATGLFKESRWTGARRVDG